MPKSRGRKSVRNSRSTRRSTGASSTRRAGQHGPGRLSGAGEGIANLLFSPKSRPDQIVEILPMFLWIEHMHGSPANICVDGCMVLHHAYEQLGIRAHPRAVDLVVTNRRTGRAVHYGDLAPSWSGTAFGGHCVLWLPDSGRIMDATVEQYREVRAHRLGPISGPISASEGTPQQLAALRQGQMPPGSIVDVVREDLVLTYTTVSAAYDNVVTGSAQVRAVDAQYRWAGVNLASKVLLHLREPAVYDRIRQAPYPRLHALVSALADAEFVVDDSGTGRFAVAGPDASTTLQRLDEIVLPTIPTAPRAATSASPVLVNDARQQQEIMDDVNTEARVLVAATASTGGGALPVVVFEPQREIRITNTVTGRYTEAQAEAIRAAGFDRFPTNVNTPPKLLPGWSVRRTLDGLELWDHGGIWARAAVELSADWLEAADRHQLIQVIYGTHTGVSIPVDVSATDYSPEHRDAELAHSRTAGVVTIARIPWRKQPALLASGDPNFWLRR